MSASLQAMTAIGLLQLQPWKPRFVGFLGSLASMINCAFQFLFKSPPPPGRWPMNPSSHTHPHTLLHMGVTIVISHLLPYPDLLRTCLKLRCFTGYMLFPALPAPKLKATLPTPHSAPELPRAPAHVAGSKVATKAA